MSRGVHQVVAGLAPHDAISNHAFIAQRLIRKSGLRSEVFATANRLHPSLAAGAHPHTAWGRVARPGDIAIIHYSIYSDAFAEILERAEASAIHYHNITPSRFFWDFAPDVALECERGRAELAELAGAFDWVASDSRFNADELLELGFPEGDVVGVMRRELDIPAHRGAPSGRVRLLFVGRGAPNKAQHDAIMALAAIREAGVDAELRLVGSWGAFESYESYCRVLAEELRVEHVVEFTGSLSDAQLGIEYARADVFLCLSDHEGYCVPIVEAMEADLPIVAYAAGAVPETAGGAALLLPEKPPSLVAEAVLEITANARLRGTLAAARDDQRERFRQPALADRFAQFLGHLR